MEDTDAKADEKFIKTERNQRNRASLYFRPSTILGFDGPNVTSPIILPRKKANVDDVLYEKKLEQYIIARKKRSHFKKFGMTIVTMRYSNIAIIQSNLCSIKGFRMYKKRFRSVWVCIYN